MDRIVIVGAARTAVGSFNGKLANVSAVTLGSVAIRGALRRSGVKQEDVDEVVLGQVLTAGCGQNAARQATLCAGIPDNKTAIAINQLCGSGLRSVAMGYQAIRNADCDIVVAGGQESMSLSPHFANLRKGTKMGSATLNDTMLTDGLVCAINGYHMGVTAENIAQRWHITREDQDRFACTSQNRAEQATQNNVFVDEIVPVTVTQSRQEIVIDTDEYPRLGTTIASLAKLRPAFDPKGSVTAGNSSGINDGAAVVVLMRESEASKKGLRPLAAIRSWATAGVDPAVMGSGPIPATRAALQRANWTVKDLDLVEANEAFAAQALCVIKELGFDPEITNVNGGAIALGHPIGASGTRILVTLLYEMQRRHANKGLATLCIGGGMGISMCLERVS